MKSKIIEDKENPLLNRRELKVGILHKGPTPSRSEVMHNIISLTKTDKDRIILGTIKTGTGIKESIAQVRIYKSKEDATKIEPKYILEKDIPKEEAKAEEVKEEPKPQKVAPEEEKEEKEKEEKKEKKKPAEKPEKKKTEGE